MQSGGFSAIRVLLRIFCPAVLFHDVSVTCRALMSFIHRLLHEMCGLCRAACGKTFPEPGYPGLTARPRNASSPEMRPRALVAPFLSNMPFPRSVSHLRGLSGGYPQASPRSVWITWRRHRARSQQLSQTNPAMTDFTNAAGHAWSLIEQPTKVKRKQGRGVCFLPPPTDFSTRNVDRRHRGTQHAGAWAEFHAGLTEQALSRTQNASPRVDTRHSSL